MGRKKIKMEFIENLGARIRKFKMRKEGLTKKIKELTTLCDIEACMIIYDPAQNRSFVWPNDRPDQVRRLIGRCKSGELKSCGVSDYLAEKKILKVERKEKYPICNEGFLDSMNEEQLRGLGDALRNKSQMIRSRIQMMQELEMMMMMINSNNSADFNNLDYNQQFLTIAPSPTATDFGNGSYMNIPSTSVPLLPQMMNNGYNNDGGDQNNYCYNVNDDGNISADCYHINNLDQEFLMNPTIATTATDFGSYMNIPSSSSSSVPLPQMMIGDQNQIHESYCYNDDGHGDDDEMKKNMMLWDGLVSTLELPYTNIAFSAEDQEFLDSLSWDV